MHRYLIKIGLFTMFPTFYKKLQGKNIQRLKVDKPMIIAMNHPNAFTDPLGLTHLAFPIKLWYLARGDVFKPGLASRILRSLRILPIFRQRDAGKEGLKKNDESYQAVYQLLKKNNKIMVFAEGLCVQERRLRPLKKGVARMFFGAHEYLQNKDLMVIPVGVNYSQPDKFRSDLFYNIGNPISIEDYSQAWNENPARTQKLFIDELESRMLELVIHINDSKNDTVVCFIERLMKRKWLSDKGLNHKNLAHDFDVTRKITTLVNTTAIEHQDKLDLFRNEAAAYFEALNNHNIQDWLIAPENQYKVNSLKLLYGYLLLIVGLPFHVAGILFNGPQLLLIQYLTKKTKAEKEFYSSIAIGIGMIVYGISYLLLFVLAYLSTSSIIISLLFYVTAFLCGRFSLYYHPFLVKVLSMTKLLKNSKLKQQFTAKRLELVNLINKF